MYSNVNPEIAKKFHEMKMEYKDIPQPEILLPIPNPHPELNYEINITSPEVTSLCPLNNSQPDYAVVIISYTPDKYIAELKSIKLYLTAFRTVSIFHEALAGQIMKDIVDTIKPKKLSVTCDFTVRGGIHTKVIAKHQKSTDI